MSLLDDHSASTVEALMTVASGRHGLEAQSGTERTVHLADGKLDRLRDPADAAYFLRHTLDWWREHSDAIDWALPAGAIDVPSLARLRLVRDAVQSLIDGDRQGYVHRLRMLADHYTFRLGVPEGGLRPTSRGWDGFTAGLVPALASLAARSGQLRRCANDACQWVIFDTTRNGTRTWCHATLCGNKIRVRRFRERQRAGLRSRSLKARARSRAG